jgi:hypothetical protein
MHGAARQQPIATSMCRGVNYNGFQTIITSGSLPGGGSTLRVLVAAAHAQASILTLYLCEDAYDGDAQFTVAIEGVPVGGVMTVKALRSAGAVQAFSIPVTLSPGVHDVAISFINDAWGGPNLDRNLFVRGADLNGKALSTGDWTADLWSNGTKHFSLLVP